MESCEKKVMVFRSEAILQNFLVENFKKISCRCPNPCQNFKILPGLSPCPNPCPRPNSCPKLCPCPCLNLRPNHGSTHQSGQIKKSMTERDQDRENLRNPGLLSQSGRSWVEVDGQFQDRSLWVFWPVQFNPMDRPLWPKTVYLRLDPPGPKVSA